MQGVVGSTAYGLAREGSDVDRLGVFVAPTGEVAGLDWQPHRESRVSTKPDLTLHEVGKFLRLCLKGNPTVNELLWLPAYDVQTPVYGADLADLRWSVLSTPAVRAAYGGYAHQQAVKLLQRGDGTFSSDTRGRTAKHARHLLRLLRQGRELLSTGHLTVRVPDPEVYFAFDTMTPEQMVAVYESERVLFDNTVSVLPEQPDRSAVIYYLNDVRRRFC